MIKVKSTLTKSEVSEVRSLISELTDVHGDFYITRNNLRLMIADNVDILLDCLKKGDKVAFDENGIILVVGYSDKSPRKYVKILVKDLKNVEGLLKVIYWNTKEDLFFKVKNTNPLKEVLLKNGFQFMGGRGKESLLVHKAIEQKPVNYKNFSKDKDE